VTTILLVEDEKSIAEPLAQFFSAEGHQVIVAPTMSEARVSMSGEVDVVILDWMLPDGSGIDLLSAWRKSGIQTPIIVLTARTELIDKVLGLELGADDYVTKPFHARELLARVHARLRTTHRRSKDEGQRLSHGGIDMDLRTRSVTYEGETLSLTKMEFSLLRLFLENPNKVLARDELLNRVWGYESFPSTRTIDTHVLQLRQKTRADLFETVRGIGYRMK
jgi:DNA-binding response OmpR family regulator